MTAYYVDNKQGHDHWAGSSGQPFATVYRAGQVAHSNDMVWVKRTSSPYKKGYDENGGAFTYVHATRTLTWTGHGRSAGDLVYMVGLAGDQYKAARVQSVDGNDLIFESPMTDFANGDTTAVYGGTGRMGHAAQQNILSNATSSRNESVKIKGYNTAIGDMDRGGDYYQSPLDCYLNGVDDTKKIKVDGNAVAEAIWKFYGDNVTVENIWFTNTDTSNEFWTMDTAENLTFRSCAFTDGRQNNSEMDLAVFYYSCYVTTSQHCFVVGNSTAWIIGCVIAPTETAISISDSAGPLHHFRIIGNLMIGGMGGVAINVIHRPVLIKNNTFYNQSAFCVAMNSEVGPGTIQSYADFYNNICVPQAGAQAIQINVTGGSFANDYNCIYGADGNPLSTPFATDADGTVPVLGPHSVQEDPRFGSIAAGVFEPMNPAVRLGGRSDAAGRQVSMGYANMAYVSDEMFYQGRN